MSIHFDSARWERVRENYEAWWNGKLNRPLVKCTVSAAYDPGRPRPAAPYLSQANCHDFSWTAEQVIDTFDWDLSQKEFMGDDFPMISMVSFGPGVLAAFCGATLDNSSGNVWFFSEEKEAKDISIRYNPENMWVKRIKDIYRAGIERWQGSVLMGLPDLGGVLDVVSTFMGAENMLIAMIDEPEQVRRLCVEADKAWWEAYEDLSALLNAGGNPGYSDWKGIYRRTPAYVLQSDASYMIGPDMFDVFVKPELAAACRRLDHSIYHLDGVGELPHLSSILDIPELNAVQWVPGSGKPTGRHWEKVYRQIAATGRGMDMVVNSEEFLDYLKDFPTGMFFAAGFSNRNQAVAYLKAAGVPE